MKRISTLVLCAILMLSLVSCADSGDTTASTASAVGQEAEAGGARSESYNYTWGACNSSSGYYALNVAVSDVINQYVAGVNMTVMETGGGSQNLEFIGSGQVQFGQTSVPDIYLSYHALGAFEEMDPNEDVRLMLALLPNVYFFAVTENSGIESISDLQGRTFSPGSLASSTERITYAVLSELGIEPDWYYASTSEAVDAIKDRRIDGFVKAGSTSAMDSSIADAKTSLPVRILSFTQEEADRIMQAYPYYRFALHDGSVYEQDEDIYAITGYYAYAVSKDVPEDVVYDIVKALSENQEYLETSYAGLAGFDPIKITATDTSGYMHPGLIRYLEEQGYTISDDQIPPELQ